MKRTVLMLMVLLAVVTVQAADYTWDGGGIDNSWTTDENWTGDSAPNGPTGTGKVKLQSGNVEMGSDVDVAMTSHLYLGGAGSGLTGDAMLTVNGGTLNSTGGYAILGYNTTDTGTLNVNSGSTMTFSGLLGLGVGWNGKGAVDINGGTVNAARLYTSLKDVCPGGSSISIYNGGLLNIDGYARLANYDDEPAAGTLADSLIVDNGTLTVSQYLIAGPHGTMTVSLSGTGSINVTEYFKLGGASYSEALMTMTGGTLNCADLIVGGDGGGAGSLDLFDGIITADTLVMNAGGFMDIAGGMLVLDGNITDITAYGDVMANGGTGTFDYEYDMVNDTTTITAVPEPATLALLGLGGLLFRKNRR